MKHYHTREPLPKRDELFWPALQWAMTRKGGYLGRDLKSYLTGFLELTQVQFAKTCKSGMNRFGNVVDWVTAEFTATGIHTGWNGEAHKSSDCLYFLTSFGYAVGERSVKKPRGGRHGPRDAKPDARQLSREQK
jgi:hypothetical protein